MPSGYVAREAARRVRILRMARDVTLRPSASAAQMATGQPPDLWTAFKVFSTAVGIVIALETVFSFAFNTAFSDLVHHAFPIVIALAGSLTVYILLKLLWTPKASFHPTVAATLMVGSAALIVMIPAVLLLLSADFLLSYDEIRDSPCEIRTIICLASGGTLIDYDVPRPKSALLGASFPLIVLVMLASAIHFSRSLAKILAATQGIARWRTYVAMTVSIIVLAPASLFAVNAVYRALYG